MKIILICFYLLKKSHSMVKFWLGFVLVSLLGCSGDESIKEQISPCENAFNRDLNSIYSIKTDDFFNANIFSSVRSSDKYTVFAGDIKREFKYVVINHQDKTYKSFERPYLLDNIISDSRLFQILDNHLYLARQDRNLGWVFESINLQNLDGEFIQLESNGEKPLKIIQVEKHKNEIYILASFEKSTQIYKYSPANKSLKVFYESADDYTSVGFKVLSSNNNSDYLIHAILDSTNVKSTIQGIDPMTQFVFYERSVDGLIRSHNFPYSSDILPMDDAGRLYLNFADSRSIILNAESGLTIKTFNGNLFPLKDDYAVIQTPHSFVSGADDIKVIELTSSDVVSFLSKNKLIYSFNYLNKDKVLVNISFSYWQIVDIKTNCIENEKYGESIIINENEFFTIDGEGLHFYKI